MSGVTTPTTIGFGAVRPGHRKGNGAKPEVTTYLPYDRISRLRSVARANQTTLSTVVQGAWALLLAHYNASNDIIFGAAFSGRPAELPEVECMIGPCVTNVPVRVKVEPGDSLCSWLSRLQQQQLDLTQHQFTTLDVIQGLTAIPLRHRLFDSIVVFQNYQVHENALHLGKHARLIPVVKPEDTNYALTLAILPGDNLHFRLIYDPARLSHESVQTYATDLKTILDAIAGQHASNVGDILEILPRATRGVARAVAAEALQRSDAAFSAPTNKIERSIAEIWQELLGLEDISIDDNFFDVGGHSVLLLHVHARLQSKIGARLPIAVLFQFPTVRTLARHLNNPTHGAAGEASAAMERANKQRDAIARRQNLARSR